MFEPLYRRAMVQSKYPVYLSAQNTAKTLLVCNDGVEQIYFAGFLEGECLPLEVVEDMHPAFLRRFYQQIHHRQAGKAIVQLIDALFQVMEEAGFHCTLEAINTEIDRRAWMPVWRHPSTGASAYLIRMSADLAPAFQQFMTQTQSTAPAPAPRWKRWLGIEAVLTWMSRDRTV